MTKRRLVKWLAGLSGLCVILLLAAAFLLPRILDSQAARDEIGAFLSSRTGGKLAVEGLDLAWFPRPAVVARGASLSLGDTVSGTIQSIAVYPSIWSLLTGRLEISRVELASPALSVRLPESAEEPSNTDDIEGQVRSLLATLAAQLPGMIVRVRGGSAEIRIGDRPPVVITDLDGRLVAPPGEMDLQFSFRANIFDSLRVEARIDGETLATQARINVDNLHLQESMSALLPGPHDYIESGTLGVNLSLTSVGLKNVKAEIEGALPSLGLVRGDRKTVIEGSAFKGVISRDAGIVNAVVERLDIASPRVTVTGGFTVDPGSSTAQLKLVGRELDVSQLRESALKLAGDIGFVETAFRYIGGGTIPEISLQTSGSSFAEMWTPHNIVVTATKRDGSLFLPGPDLNLEDVSGSIVVSGGMVEATGFSARLGKIRGRDGTLRLGLEGTHAPFHLELTFQTDAAELRSLLLRVVKDDGFRTQLSKIRNLKGGLSGRLMLGERIDSFSPKVSLFPSAVRGSHDLIPYSLSITEGRFAYGDGKIELENVRGAVGLSSFSGLTGSVSNDESRQIEIVSGRFSLDVAQTKSLLNRFHVWPDELRDFDFARGRLELASVSLKGPWDDPSRWDFTSAGTLGEIAVQHVTLPGVMKLSGGTFRATPAKFTVSNTTVNLLDASLRVDGSLESPGNAPLSLESAAAGSIGAEMTGWLSGHIGLPKQFLLRSPLQLTTGRVFWKKDGDVGFRGEFTVAGGPRLSLDMVRAPHAVEVKEVLIVDGAQRAPMTLDLKEDQFAFSFTGALEQRRSTEFSKYPARGESDSG